MPRKLSPAAVEAARKRYAGSALEKYNKNKKALKEVAVETFQQMPPKAQKKDLKTNEPKTKVIAEYMRDPEKYDWPGVDTKYAKRKYHKSEKRVALGKARYKGSALERYNKERAARKTGGATNASMTTVSAAPVSPPPVNKPPPPPVGPAPKTTGNALGATLARLQAAIETVAPEGMDIDGFEPQSGGELEETNNPVGAAVAVVDDGASAVAVPFSDGNVVIDVVSGATRFIENFTGQ